MTTAAVLPNGSLDPSPIVDPRTYQQGVPYDLLAQLRRQTPVCWMEEPPLLGLPAGPGFWAVFRHDDVKTVLRDHSRFSSSRGGTQIRDYDTSEQLAEVRKQILNMDPPGQTRLRRLITASFTPKAVALLESKITARAGVLMAELEACGRADFAQLIADLPLYVLAEVLGVPESDRYLLYDWANRVIGYQDPEYSVSAAFEPAGGTEMARVAVGQRPVAMPDGRLPNPRTRAGLADLYAYARELAAYRRRHPGNDVMSILLHAQDQGGPVGLDEFENIFWLFAVAGNETLRNGIPGGTACLLEHPAEYRRLVEDPALVASAVEEMLRYWPPVMHFRRTATVDVDMRGQRVAAGQKVVVWHSAANRDEQVFNEPDRFDVARRPNAHLSFGFGTHFCLGAHLARAQMRAVFTHMVTRFPGLEPDGPPVRLLSNFQNGVKHLPLRVVRPAGRRRQG